MPINYRKEYKSMIEIFLKMRKLWKQNYADNRNKHIPDEEKKRRYGKLLL